MKSYNKSSESNVALTFLNNNLKGSYKKKVLQPTSSQYLCEYMYT